MPEQQLTIHHIGDGFLSKYKIIMTGGGSAGHVTPNLALIPKLKDMDFEVKYIGGKDGIEKDIISKEGIPFYEISTGKLRRYFDVKNFSDPFKVLKGVFQSISIMRKEKPDIVFSKGGFVSVPVVLGAYFNKIPVISHESDITPGLANKLITPYCTKLCVTFPESLKYIKSDKGVVTGTPIRKELFTGSREACLKITGFNGRRPILLIIGGSLGSQAINGIIRRNIDLLLKEYDIIHLCGKGNIDSSMNNKSGYRQMEYANEEMKHFIAGSDLIVSRAGANSIFEILALKKPNLLIPLSKKASRGDQVLNAHSFKNSGYSMVVEEENLTDYTFIEAVKSLYNNKNTYIKAMEKSKAKNGTDNIIKIIVENLKER